MSLVDYDTSSRSMNESQLGSSQLISQLNDPEEMLIHQQNLERVKGLVEQLQPKYRELVKLRFFDEYTYEEISIALNLPMGMVKAQLFRARELLHEMLGSGCSNLLQE